MKILTSQAMLVLLYACVACNNSETKTTGSSTSKEFRKGTYGYDAGFLKQHTKKVLELQDEKGQAKVLLSADYQGRVMTSTAAGDSNNSFGWMNHDLIAAKEKKKQFNPVGGEERFWMGPEGGQYAIYFKKGDSFDISHWQVPAVIDRETYDVAEANPSHVVFTKQAILSNYSGTEFNIGITRSVQLLLKDKLEQKLKTKLPSNIQYVAFETTNELRNNSKADWKKENGLLSIWLLGMMTPTDETKVIIPFTQPPASALKQYGVTSARQLITDNYFGTIPADRLQIKDSVLFFRCDGKSRGKIGLSPLIAKPIAASFDFKKNVLTVVIPEIHRNTSYVNSKWELQKEPYKGDVINSYNDGPLTNGSQLGPFYEIESSSPAVELKAGQSLTYRQTTCHFQGDYNALKELAKTLTGVNLDEVKQW